MPKHLKWLAIITAITLISACNNHLHSPQEKPADRPKHHSKSGFRNLYIEEPQKNFFSFVKMRLFGETEWANHQHFATQIPWQKLDLHAIHNPKLTQISWLGHSSFLIQHKGVNYLTDPHFSERASPLSWVGPKRYTKPVTDYRKLPKINFVIISHNHYDHLDEASVVQLSQQPQLHFVVPLGIDDWLIDKGIDKQRISSLDWYDEVTIADSKFTAYPSQHWSARGLFDRFETLWASWRVEFQGFSFWFAGDTGYNRRLFTELGKRMPAVDLSLIPIGDYEPRYFMQTYHINPEEAVKIHKHLRTKQSIAMNWGTFALTAEKPIEPPMRLEKALQQAGVSEQEFQLMRLGETRAILSSTKPSISKQ